MTTVALRSSAQRPSAAVRRGPVLVLVPHAASTPSKRSSRSKRSTGPYLRRRLGVAVAAMVLAVAVVGVSSTRFADAGQARPAGDAPAGASVVIVQPGDTLWSLAREVQPDGDIRPLVAQLSRAHGGSSLRAGERIVVPAP